MGGIIVVAVMGLVALMGLALRTPEANSLAAFCQENPGNCFSEGPADAPVTLVEVSDYNCSHCRNFNLQTAGLLHEQYVETGQVRWVYVPFALRVETIPPAAAALCAGEQGRFPEFHRLMFEMQGSPQALTRDGFLLAAGQLGLDLESFGACVDGGKYNDAVQENIRAANLMGVRATPTFFINDEKAEGNLPLAEFQRRIDALLVSQ
ncbi:MAG: DsbA family protein [Chloroflexi bacterium]|nr:DsbA family protein [Chloroflexota bacterium]